MARMIDALANRNQPPRLVDYGGDKLPLFPADYDWKEQERVLEALRELASQDTVEAWEALLEHADDERYSLTLVNNSGTYALGNWTVGRFCRQLAYDQLVAVFEQHLPPHPGKPGPLDLEVGCRRGVTLAAWRKKRMDRSVAELQIEVCERALKELREDDRVSQHEKAPARKKIQAEIEKLRRTKRAVLREGLLFTWLECYTAQEAKRCRELYERYRENRKRKGAPSRPPKGADY